MAVSTTACTWPASIREPNALQPMPTTGTVIWLDPSFRCERLM